MLNGIWAALAAIIAFVISAAVGKFLIPALHKLKYGQTILDIGPSWHKKKEGTPTMGGIMFIIAIVVATATEANVCPVSLLLLFQKDTIGILYLLLIKI